MKTVILSLLLVLGLNFSFAQNQKPWQEAKNETSQTASTPPSHEEHMARILQYKQKQVLKALNLPEEKRKAFVPLYQAYQNKMMEIKHSFKPVKNPDAVSDQEAREDLEKSFKVGQALLDQRKVYAAKFLQILTPQQVIKIFQTEGLLRDKMIKHKAEHCK